MPKISALLHTHNDALGLGRALDSLWPCDEVLVIDECSELRYCEGSATARSYPQERHPRNDFRAYAMDTFHDWVLCLRLYETLSDDLEASRVDWKNAEPADGVACYRFDVREQKQSGWQRCPPEVRLINRRLMNWVGEMPANQKFDLPLSGDLLRFHQP
jgi:hypothetical protein